MEAISKYLENLRDQISAKKLEIINNGFKCIISPSEFKEAFVMECEKEMLNRNIDKSFIIDESNKNAINNLFLFITKDVSFKGDLAKGILLAGAIGVGKTLILNSVCNIIENCTNKIVTRVHSKRLAELITSADSGYYDKRPIFIDDLGREQKEINNFGTKEMPLVDLLSIRYDFGSITFATTNFNMDELTKFYGLALTDRFKEMFNIFEMKGVSKRC